MLPRPWPKSSPCGIEALVGAELCGRDYEALPGHFTLPPKACDFRHHTEAPTRWGTVAEPTVGTIYATAN